MMRGSGFFTSAVMVVGLAAVGVRGQEPMKEARLPADEGAVEEAIVTSPRHGEWVDVAVAGEEAAVHAWVVYPERADKGPVVVVIHEIFGMTDWVRAVADELAAAGFVAIVPDLLSGKGPGGGGTESFEGDDVRRAIQELTAEQVVRRLDAVRAYALALPAAGDTSAVIGFCWGGSSSFMYATRQPKLDAAVVYYGTAPTAKEDLARIACPVLGLYGGDDARVTATVAPTAAVMTELGKSYAPVVYDGAGHGFLRQQSGRDGANMKAAVAAWERTVGFLREHLEAKGDRE